MKRLILRFPLLQGLDLLAQLRGARPWFIRITVGGIGFIQLVQIAIDLFLNRFNRFGQTRCVEVAPPIVHRLELAAVDGHQLAAKQFQLLAQLRELLTNPLDGLQVVAPKVSDRFEVRAELSQQPHHFDVDFRLALQHSRRAHPIQIPIQVESQKVARIVSRPPRLRRLRAVESQPGQIQTAHEGIDEANRIVFSDIILDRFGKEHDLLSTDAAYVIHQRCSFLIALTNVDDDTNFKCQSFHTVCRWTRAAGACFAS